MRFKTNAIIFIEKIAMLCLWLFICVALIVGFAIVGGMPMWGYILLSIGACISVMIMLSDILGEQEEIMMDESGISCVKGSIVQWEYRWSEIACLYRITLFGHPGISIGLTEETLSKIAPQDQKTISFQLCLTAKKALKLYSPYPLLKKGGGGD